MILEQSQAFGRCEVGVRVHEVPELEQSSLVLACKVSKENLNWILLNNFDVSKSFESFYANSYATKF